MKTCIKKMGIFMLVCLTLLLATSCVNAQDEKTEITLQEKQTQSMVVLACAIAMAIAGIASATGLGVAGVSAAAVTAEKPELFAKSLILQMLPMTQTIYALITSILLLMGAGLLGGKAAMDLSSPAMGMAAVFTGLLVGLTGLSAISQGIISSAGISATGRSPNITGRAIIFAVMPETIAIFGFLVALLIMVLGLKILG